MKIEQHLEDKWGDRYARYRDAWESFDPKFHLKGFPYELDIILQDACNQRCLHCHQRYRRRSYDIMPDDIFLPLMAEAKRNGLEAINFGAADEPFLNVKLLHDAVRCASEADIMEVFVHTNGTASPERVIGVARQGVTHLSFSLDAATQETYGAIRGHDTFPLETIETRVRTAKRADISSVRVSFCPTPINHLEAREFLDKWNRKVDRAEFQPIYRHTNPGLEIPDGIFVPAGREFRCLAPWRRVAVWPDGLVTLCCAYRFPDVVVGDLKRETMEAIWTGDRLAAVRERFEHRDPPGTCRMCHESLWRFVWSA